MPSVQSGFRNQYKETERSRGEWERERESGQRNRVEQFYRRESGHSIDLYMDGSGGDVVHVISE